MTIYDEITDEILNLKQAKDKVFLPILILSMLDYYKDTKQPENTFNTMTNVTVLVPYYRAYLSYPPILNKTYSNPSNKLDDTNILMNIWRNPLCALHPSKFFKNYDLRILANDDQHYTVKDKELPFNFMVEITDNFDNDLMIEVIRIACYRLIFKHIGVALTKLN